MKHVLPTDTINKVLNYLSGRPYTEVVALVNEIKAVAVQFAEPSVLQSQSCEDKPSSDPS